jgi:hypothetical protein
MTFLIFDDSIQFNLHKNVIKKTLDCGGKKKTKNLKDGMSNDTD